MEAFGEALRDNPALKAAEQLLLPFDLGHEDPVRIVPGIEFSQAVAGEI